MADNTTRSGEHDGAREGAMSVREAGRRGGEARKQQLGPGGYAALGKLGGQARKAQLGPQGYAELGRKGGERVSQLVQRGRQAEGDGATRTP